LAGGIDPHRRRQGREVELSGAEGFHGEAGELDHGWRARRRVELGGSQRQVVGAYVGPRLWREERTLWGCLTQGRVDQRGPGLAHAKAHLG
jgi:hypothetical protein